MALALCNTHGELTPLERGMHALKSGMDVKAYAEKVGRARTTVQDEVKAARVAASVTDIRHDVSHNILAAIHAAPSYLWPALVEAAAAEDWTVERVRKAVAAVKDAPAPAGWWDGQAVARVGAELEAAQKRGEVAKRNDGVNQHMQGVRAEDTLPATLPDLGIPRQRAAERKALAQLSFGPHWQKQHKRPHDLDVANRDGREAIGVRGLAFPRPLRRLPRLGSD